MHYFDPTVDWPIELLEEEPPDLLYLKSNDPLNLSIQLHFPHAANHLCLITPWVEYRSLDTSQSVAMLFIDPNRVKHDPTAEQDIEAMLQSLKGQQIEIGRYRKIHTVYTQPGSSTGSDSLIWSWAFRPLADHQLQACLSTFGSFCSGLPVIQAAKRSTTYRRLPMGKTVQPSTAPAALIVHHMDETQGIAEQPPFSQEMLHGHTVLERTILGFNPVGQFSNLAGNIWPGPESMMTQTPL